MSKPLVVIDTNVYVSAAIVYKESTSKLVLKALQDNKIKVAISEALLKELGETLRKPQVRKYTGLNLNQEKAFVEAAREISSVVSSGTKIHISPDPDDNHLFSCAIAAKADYIISGDKKHVLSIPEYKGVRTVSPRDFVDNILPQYQYEKAA